MTVTVTIYHLPARTLRPRRVRSGLSSVSAVQIATYRRATLHDGALAYRSNRRPLLPQEAGDMAEAIIWARISSKADKPSTTSPVPGIDITARGLVVEIAGFGPPLKGLEVDDLIYELQRFYRVETHKQLIARRRR